MPPQSVSARARFLRPRQSPQPRHACRAASPTEMAASLARLAMTGKRGAAVDCHCEGAPFAPAAIPITLALKQGCLPHGACRVAARLATTHPPLGAPHGTAIQRLHPARRAPGKTDDSANTSGMGKGHPLPAGAKGWSWGAFLLNWIWAIGNRTWIGLLSLLPYIGFIFSITLGIKGREWAWQNKRWDSLKHCTEEMVSVGMGAGAGCRRTGHTGRHPDPHVPAVAGLSRPVVIQCILI